MPSSTGPASHVIVRFFKKYAPKKTANNAAEISLLSHFAFPAVIDEKTLWPDCVVILKMAQKAHDSVEDWELRFEDSHESIMWSGRTTKRFSTLFEIVESISMHGCPVDHLAIDMVILCLPAFASSNDFFQLLRKRFDESDNGDSMTMIKEQHQLKVLAVIRHWASLTHDICGSLVDDILDFLGEAENKSSSVATSARKLKVCSHCRHVMINFHKLNFSLKRCK